MINTFETEIFNGKSIMKQWDRWIEYYKSGEKGSWPRDAFESILDEFLVILQYIEKFISSEEKMCPVDIELYNEIIKWLKDRS